MDSEHTFDECPLCGSELRIVASRSDAGREPAVPTFIKKPFPEERPGVTWHGIPGCILVQLEQILNVAGKERFLEAQSYFVHGVHWAMSLFQAAAEDQGVAGDQGTAATDAEAVVRWMRECGWDAEPDDLDRRS
jgi:hypothetical protein